MKIIRDGNLHIVIARALLFFARSNLLHSDGDASTEDHRLAMTSNLLTNSLGFGVPEHCLRHLRADLFAEALNL